MCVILSTTTELVLNGVKLQVTYDPNRMKETLNSLEKQFEGQYTKMYTVDEEVTKEEFEEDIQLAREFVAKLESGSFELSPHVEKVRKKKNQKFWSNSGYDVLTLSNISEYFTDFTNAWSVFVFRFEVINETTCELVLRSRTYTN
jgi:tRNA(Ile)-lysidine synthase TilS/MesJ